MKKFFRALVILLIAFPWAIIQIIYNKFSYKKYIRVLIYHHVDISSFEKFLRQINFIQKKYNIITPAQFEEFESGKYNIEKNSVLLTIDDGFKSGSNLEDQVFYKNNIKVIYFIVNDFIKCQEYSENIKFIKNNFQIKDEVEVDRLGKTGSLNMCEIKNLLEAGHTIGAHTRSHIRLSTLLRDDDLYSEVISSANELGSDIGVPIRHFAFTFGDIKSIGINSLKLTMKNFDFIYTGIRGKNFSHSKLIYRDAVDVDDGALKLWIILNGGYDIFYFMDKLKLWMMLKK